MVTTEEEQDDDDADDDDDDKWHAAFSFKGVLPFIFYEFNRFRKVTCMTAT